MGATQDEPVRSEAGLARLGGGFGQVDAQHFAGDRVGSPAFLDQRDQQRAGFLEHTQTAGEAGFPISPAPDGRGGGEHCHVAGAGVGAGRIRAGFDDAQDGHRHGIPKFRHGQGGGCVAGDDQVLGTLPDEEAGALNRVAGHRGRGLRAVRQPRGVAEVQVARAGQAGSERA